MSEIEISGFENCEKLKLKKKGYFVTQIEID